MPSRMPPTGRMKKPTPKVAVVSKSEAYWLSAGKNKRAMITAKNPKTMKSYHSRALPITAAAIWNGFGADDMIYTDQAAGRGVRRHRSLKRRIQDDRKASLRRRHEHVADALHGANSRGMGRIEFDLAAQPSDP